ncbi:MAG: AAA family ATPase [Candidatus Micrarchaeia archaeon]
MASIAIVTGSPGSGKSTLLKGIKGYKIANIGDLMLKNALSRKYVDNRDKLRFLSTKKTDFLRELAFKDVKAMKGNVIIDTHASVEQNGRFVPGLPRSSMMLLGKGAVKALIYVYAPTKEVLARRRSDPTRKREKEPAEIIDIQHAMDIASIAQYSSDLNIPMYIVINRQGEIKKSTALLDSYLKDAFGR